VQAQASVVEQVNAGKQKVSPFQALKLAHSVRHVFVAKGKKLVHFDMKKSPPPDAELKQLMLGPSGNLRAPTTRSGERLFVGFNSEEFADRLWGARS
jgi:hypothetical protein